MPWTFQFVAVDECSTIDGPTVVVDVLRAYSFAACAFSVGADEVLLVKEVDEALELKAVHEGAVACKDREPAEGFEFTNSPAAVLEHDLTGRVVIQRTTAGTQGAIAARHCRPLYCASLLTASATAAALRTTVAPQPMAFVITGGGGRAEEDLACAEYIAALLNAEDADPAPFVARAAASRTAKDLEVAFRSGFAGVHERDVETCLDVDRFPFALVATNAATHVSLRARAPS